MCIYCRLYRAMSTSVVEAFCFSNPIVIACLHLVCAPFVLELTRLGIKMERRIARDGDLNGACRWLVDIATKGIHVQGTENIPLAGPLLFVSNHAGLGDAHALLAASPRRDTKLMANDFGILPGLQHFRRHVIVVDKDQPAAALRASLRHLNAGGSLLLYPRGEIEADPGIYLDDALRTLPAMVAEHRSLCAAGARVDDCAGRRRWCDLAEGAAKSCRPALSRSRQTPFPGGDFPDDVPVLSRSGYQLMFWPRTAGRRMHACACACADGVAAATCPCRAG